jgi:3-deoxy-7-phosphoheptulonate synthase
MPVGFKNLTSGNWMKSVDGVLAAIDPHSFLSMDIEGKVSHVKTKGNATCHVVLRGGEEEPNYHIDEVRALTAVLNKEKIPTGMTVTFSISTVGPFYFLTFFSLRQA